MKAKGVYLKGFNQPLEIGEFDLPALKEGEVLVEILAAGVCGSDVHMWRGNDPRIKLPLILGHEGVGRALEIKGKKRDIFGQEIKKGNLLIWDRGVTCGECYFCAVKKMSFLCPYRQVYGISRDGCYATHLILFKETKIISMEEFSAHIDPAILVSASCSGATAAHSVESASIKEGDTVIIQGPGPLGIFALSLSRERGADKLIVMGTAVDKERLALSKEFGATLTLNIEEKSFEERLSLIKEITHGLGADVVIDCSGFPGAINEGIKMTAAGGTYLLPGIATPVKEVPLRFYEEVSRKNLRIQGIWVSDTSHLYQAVKMIASKRYPFEKLITHRFKLKNASEALETMESRNAIKAVLEM